MKRQILISLLVLLTANTYAGAFELPGITIDISDESTAYKQNELIVCFADPDPGTQTAAGPEIIGPLSRRAIRDTISNYIIDGASVDKEYDNVSSGLAVVKLPQDATVADAFLKFNLSANVRYAEPNYKFKLLDLPNVTSYRQFYGTDNTIQTGGTIGTGTSQSADSDIIVAVIDTGIDYTHPDLVDNIWINNAELNGTPDVDDDGNGYIDDIYGYDFAGATANDPDDSDSDPIDSFFHGTHVAGIIETEGKNNEDILSSNYNIKILALKVFADDYALEPEVFADDAVEAIGYAIDKGAKVINASWGGNSYSQALYDAIEDAGDNGLLFVAAAGNDYGSDNDLNPVYPASYDLDNIISVTSKDSDGRLSVFSNYGAASVDIAEPGTDILSTTPSYETFAMVVNGVSTNYDILSGTSMATPHASAACAILWSQYASLPNLSIKNMLLNTADPIPTISRFSQSNGSINLHEALLALPRGGAGQILNATKYNPDNPEDSLYDFIQDAIDDAADGDELIVETNSIYTETIDFKGKAITLRSGDIDNPDDPNISPDDTYILGSSNPETSVVTFANGEGPDTVIKGIAIGWGSAEYGGGIVCEGSSPTITDCIITNNTSTRRGGAIDCYNASPLIINCQITENFAEDIGGGISCYNSNPTIINCLLDNNAAVYEGGGIALDASSPTITNCTIIIDQPDAPQDGGIYAYNNSIPTIKNCILWGNGDDLYNCSATYSNIENNDQGGGNIHLEPEFIEGPLGKYYLTQIAAGQTLDSPGLDAGSNDAVNLDDFAGYTTRTDSQADDGAIDMGYHYLCAPTEYAELTIYEVINNEIIEPNQSRGMILVDPNTGPYRKYEIVTITAIPNAGYRIKEWFGTDDDSSTDIINTVTIKSDTIVAIEFEERPRYTLRTEVIGGHGAIDPYYRSGHEYYEGEVVELKATPDDTYIVDQWEGTDNDGLWSSANTVTMDSDKTITVSFRIPVTLHVPGQHRDISYAIEAAYTHGDKIIVSSGIYSNTPYDFQGKAITIASEHPDDPCCVAATIIELYGYYPPSTMPANPAFIFQSGEGNDSIVDGFTIQGQGDPGYAETEPNSEDPMPGLDATGGAITCLNGSSPTLSNLVIKNCVARGGDGENNVFEPDAPAEPEEALEPLDPPDEMEELPDPIDPGDDSIPVDGIPGADGADGAAGEAGVTGENGADALPGGDGGSAYGGAMYFDAGCSPVIKYCKIIDCLAVGGDGGWGGFGQDGQDGQDGQAGQDGQDGQDASEALNGGNPAAGGNGGNGGDGGAGGNGGNGGNGGDGGDGGIAMGGAIFFGPDCSPTIISCEITNCVTRQGLGNSGGDGGNGGAGGAGAAPGDGGSGGSGEPDGEDGEAGAEGEGGTGGDGGAGGNSGGNGTVSWAGAIYFGENCNIVMQDTIITENQTTSIVPAYEYGGGDGGDGGAGGDGDGDAAGGNGGNGGAGGAGGPTPVEEEDDEGGGGTEDEDDPNTPNTTTGTGGPGGEPGEGGDAGEDGDDGMYNMSYTTSYGGANFYNIDCNAVLTSCTLNYNTCRQTDGDGDDGGGEYYYEGCKVTLDDFEAIGNTSGYYGYGGGQFFGWGCSININDGRYISNNSGCDGGGIFCYYECALDINDSSFISNETLWSYGAGGALYAGGALNSETGQWYNGGSIKITDSTFGSNKASFGGAIQWYGDGAEVLLSKVTVSKNTADHGGGIYWSGGAPTISDCSFIGNKSQINTIPSEIDYIDWFYGGGGGMFGWSSNAKIENCFITGNSSAGSGGGVYIGGTSDASTIKNCLIKGNSAIINGGGVMATWLSTPTISNCTIVENSAYDANNTTHHGRGGGLSCSYGSQTALLNNIFWDNTGTKGKQISIGYILEPDYLEIPSTLTVNYCDIQGGQTTTATYIESGRILQWGQSNINQDPQFITDTDFAGTYYLTQNLDGTQVDNPSPCVDAGSDLAVNLNMDDLTTRIDDLGDEGVVDMGFHYPTGDETNKLTIKVIGEHGSVWPEGGTFPKHTKVTLTATVDLGYGVNWLGTDDDNSNALVNTVLMNTDKTVIVEFTEYVGKTVTVPGDYTTLQNAIYAAQNGDTIVLDRGTHYGGYLGQAVEIDKSITITSANPDDPCCVAATIIDGYAGMDTGYNNNGFYFGSTCDSKTILNGITIRNCGGYAGDAEDGTRTPANHPNGYDGSCLQGAAIYIYKGASPVIKNCIIINNWLTGGNGGDGANATSGDIYQNAGRGGWGGWARGAGIYCGPETSPKFINCIIENNRVTGGNGGNGGNQDAQGGYMNYGGNWSAIEGYYFDPYSDVYGYVYDDLWSYFEWDYASTYGEIYNQPLLTSYINDYRYYSGYGGGAFCDIDSNVKFVNCQIRGNRTSGGMSGRGGLYTSGRPIEPLVPYEIPSYGAGVYCAAGSRVDFTECTFEDNIASGTSADEDPNHSLDPYRGYGGGVCSENGAYVTFTDCNFADNESDTGGGIYLDDAEITMDNCILISNDALRGGGLCSLTSLVEIYNSNISNNRATTDINDPNDDDVYANGAGLFCSTGGIIIQDCNISGNLAEFSGGGAYLRDLSYASLNNNLITNNGADRDGGGVSVNWYTMSILSNCTIAGNSSTGFGTDNNQENEEIDDDEITGIGGGLYCSYLSDCTVKNSIFWDNYAVIGNGIAVATGFEYDNRPSTLSIYNCDIKNGRNGIWLNDGCTLNYENNINQDPLFVPGLLGRYYLSQTSAGQLAQSPCVDAGSDYTSALGLSGYTTRTDGVTDTGLIDMGYHYLVQEQCSLCDLAFDGIIDFQDFSLVASQWSNSNCSEGNNWCQGADVTLDSIVDFKDILLIADCWLAKDTTAPTPNPSRWETEPYLSSSGTITMIAKTTVDFWGWEVEYYFECIGNENCHNSGWQTNPNYTDSGLNADEEYGYRVKTRDGVGNETEWSETRYAGNDTTPPAPAPYIESIIADSETSVTMTSTVSDDHYPVEYYFEAVTEGGHDSGWLEDPNYTDTELDPNTEYGYRVKARDLSSNMNETDWSVVAYVTTPLPADLTAPTPDPMEWSTETDPNGYSGLPREYSDGGGSFDYWVTMTAAEATDDNGGIEYYFWCTNNSAFSSGWIEDSTYTVQIGHSGQGLTFRVKARDLYHNETEWSPEEMAIHRDPEDEEEEEEGEQ